MNKHLTLAERKAIESALNRRESLRSIASTVLKSPSTISREIRKHAETVFKGCYGRTANCCLHRYDCSVTSLCNTSPKCRSLCFRCSRCNTMCPDFKEEVCPQLSVPPYVCNGCPNRHRCTLKKRIYSAKSANDSYEKTLHEAREGFNISDAELADIDSFFSPLIKQGQSLYHIIRNNRDTVPCSESTARRLLLSGILEARKIDLPRAVRFKKRKGKRNNMKVDKKCREGRTYNDFLSFSKKHPDMLITEIDSVVGTAGGKVLLTVILRNCNFMLAFLRDKNTAQSVEQIFTMLFTLLGRKRYKSMFQVLLADNGTEFSNPTAIEKDPDGERKSYMFYCNPQAPQEKPKVENNHTLIRRILPKGTTFDNLSQTDINLMMSHINSYGRKKFNGKSPAEIFINLYGEDVLHLLGLELIPPQDICLKRTLLAGK